MRTLTTDLVLVEDLEDVGRDGRACGISGQRRASNQYFGTERSWSRFSERAPTGGYATLSTRSRIHNFRPCLAPLPARALGLRADTRADTR